MVLDASAGESSRVRSWVRLLLADHDATDALLIVDVLVTDASEQGQSPSAMRLTITQAGTRLLIEVDSTDQRSVAIPGRRSMGLGRLMLEALTRAWGVDREGVSKTAWAELDLVA